MGLREEEEGERQGGHLEGIKQLHGTDGDDVVRLFFRRERRSQLTFHYTRLRYFQWSRSINNTSYGTRWV